MFYIVGFFSASGGSSCVRSSAVGGGTHVSSGGGSTPPNAAVGARWRSMHVRFVTDISTGIRGTYVLRSILGIEVCLRTLVLLNS